MMKQKDRNRLKSIIQTLEPIGIKTFLILGTRKTPSCKKDEVETFYALNGDNKEHLIAALRSIFRQNIELTDLLISLLHEVVHTEKRKLEELSGSGASIGPMARA